MSAADDVVAVRGLLDAYADVVCRRAWDELGELFAPDVAITIAKAGGETIRLAGPAAFAAFVGPAMAPFEFFVFGILNARVDLVDVDHATSRMAMTEIRQSAGEFNQVFGRYDDAFARIDGRWWFTERRYRTMARTSATSMGLDVF